MASDCLAGCLLANKTKLWRPRASTIEPNDIRVANTSPVRASESQPDRHSLPHQIEDRTRQLGGQTAKLSRPREQYDCIKLLSEAVMRLETVGLKTRPVSDQKKIYLDLGLAGLVLCCETRSCYDIIMKDTATFQVLFIVSLFCACNLTTFQISSGVYLLKS